MNQIDGAKVKNIFVSSAKMRKKRSARNILNIC